MRSTRDLANLLSTEATGHCYFVFMHILGHPAIMTSRQMAPSSAMRLKCLQNLKSPDLYLERLHSSAYSKSHQLNH